MNPITFNPQDRIDATREVVADCMLHGTAVTCPVCDRGVRVGTESMNGTRVAMLMVFCHFNPFNWMHKTEINELLRRYSVIPDTNVGSGDFAKIAHWGLIERQALKPSDEGVKLASGIWRMTKAGRDFVAGRIPIHPSMRRYNREFLGWTNKPMAFIDDLKSVKFDLTEAIKHAPMVDFSKKPIDESV